MLGHRRRRCPAFIQHWAEYYSLLCAAWLQCTWTLVTLTRLDVAPSTSALANIQSTLSSTPYVVLMNVVPLMETLNQCCIIAGPPVRNIGTTQIQHCATIDAYPPEGSYGVKVNVHFSSERTKAQAL